MYVDQPLSKTQIADNIIGGDTFDILRQLPQRFADLLILDPPYNLSKNYHGNIFRKKDKQQYQQWFSGLIEKLIPTLKKTATIYICSDWKTSIIIAPILAEHFELHNRITWERDKGRGAKSNWKDNTEDIWFCSVSNDYYFDVESVKLKKKVIAPYRINGEPKGWEIEKDGHYRMTHPSNIWTDITIPFWSMPENTDHPTQKPEKLIAKLILASSRAGDLIFDPFIGSGTSAVVAKKLRRKYCGIEQNKEYCCWAIKRLKLADEDPSIQGYENEVFRERNSGSAKQSRQRNKNKQEKLF